MNKDTFKGKWKQLKGKIKEKWGKLTDDDLTRINGKKEQFFGALQEKYGWKRERIEEELRKFEEECCKEMKISKKKTTGKENMKNLEDLFIHELKLMYDAEKAIVNTLPKIIEAVSCEELKEALKKHLEETKEQVERLEEISAELDQDFSGVISKSMKSLLEEASEVIVSGYQSDVTDAALINCVQRVEHFEIASYGTLKCFTKMFGYDRVLELLEETSKEEGHANKLLNKIAEGRFYKEGVNEKAKTETTE